MTEINALIKFSDCSSVRFDFCRTTRDVLSEALFENKSSKASLDRPMSLTSLKPNCLFVLPFAASKDLGGLSVYYTSFWWIV
jgi:hypothetical protein